MKFSSFHLFHQHAGWSEREVYRYNIELVEFMEKLGFHGVWLAEHHFRDYGLCNSTTGLLSYLAARTSDIRLGSGVIILPLHNPVLIAEELAQLDVLSNGRVDVGVGRGYQAAEFDRFGVELSSARESFEEALDLIQRLWRDENVTHLGQFHRCHDVTLKPKPLQPSGPPLYVAAVSPDTVSRYAQRGFPILVDAVATFKNIGRAAYTWRQEMAAAGHTVTADLCAMRSVYVAATDAQARADMHRFELGFDRSRIVSNQSAPIDSKTGEIAKGYEFWQEKYLKGGTLSDDFRWDQIDIIGSPERVIGQINMLKEFGFGNIMCDFGSTRPMPLADMKKVIKFFADEVMSAFR